MKKDYSKKYSLVYVLFAYITAFAAAWITVIIVPGEWSPFLKGFVADLSATGIIFMFSLIVGNSSVYDSYWSIVPPVLYGYWIIRIPDSGGSGLLIKWLFFMVVCLWAIRLTLGGKFYWHSSVSNNHRICRFSTCLCTYNWFAKRCFRMGNCCDCSRNNNYAFWNSAGAYFRYANV